MTGQGRRDKIDYRLYEGIDMNNDAPKTMRINVIIDSDLHKSLRIKTILEKKSISAVVNEALNAFLVDKYESNPVRSY